MGIFCVQTNTTATVVIVNPNPNPELGDRMQVQQFRPNGQSNDVQEFNSTGVAAAVTGVQARVFMARQFPRDEQRAAETLQRYCESFDFAIDALYAFPRGETTVVGLSVIFARAAVQQWGNMTSGWEQIGETPDSVIVQGFCWDLQTNATKTYSMAVGKKVMKKIWENRKHVGTEWIPADERQLRELVARTGSMMERNAVINSLPLHFVQKCLEKAKVTVAANSSTPQAIERTKQAFANIGVTEQQLEQYAGKPLKKLPSTSPVWTELPVIYRRIKAGELHWNEVLKARYDAMSDYDAEPEPDTQPPASQQAPNNPPLSAPVAPDKPTPPVTTPPTAQTQQSENPPQQTNEQTVADNVQTQPEQTDGRKPLTPSDFTTDEWSTLTRQLWVAHKVQPAKTAEWVAGYDGTKAQLLEDAAVAFEAKNNKKGK